MRQVIGCFKFGLEQRAKAIPLGLRPHLLWGDQRNSKGRVIKGIVEACPANSQTLLPVAFVSASQSAQSTAFRAEPAVSRSFNSCRVNMSVRVSICAFTEVSVSPYRAYGTASPRPFTLCVLLPQSKHGLFSSIRVKL